jgi:hypothetical protein
MVWRAPDRSPVLRPPRVRTFKLFHTPVTCCTIPSVGGRSGDGIGNITLSRPPGESVINPPTKVESVVAALLDRKGARGSDIAGGELFLRVETAGLAPSESLVAESLREFLREDMKLKRLRIVCIVDSGLRTKRSREDRGRAEIFASLRAFRRDY